MLNVLSQFYYKIIFYYVHFCHVFVYSLIFVKSVSLHVTTFTFSWHQLMSYSVIVREFANELDRNNNRSTTVTLKTCFHSLFIIQELQGINQSTVYCLMSNLMDREDQYKCFPGFYLTLSRMSYFLGCSLLWIKFII